jgi:hypothetical protein
MKAPACSTLLAAALVVLSLLAVGCEDANQPRSELMVTELVPAEGTSNLVAEPYECDVRDAGDDGTLGTEDDAVYEDQVVITVENQPSSSLLSLSPDGPFGNVTLTSYTVTYDVPGESLTPIDGALHVVIPTGEDVSFSIVLVTGQAKIEPPLVTLLTTGGELQGDARITLHGVEQTSDADVTVEAAIRVHFANWADD